MNIDSIMKYILAIVLLFIMFLWSGGVYETFIAEKVRVNKITGAVEVLKKENELVGWYDVN